MLSIIADDIKAIDNIGIDYSAFVLILGSKNNGGDVSNTLPYNSPMRLYIEFYGGKDASQFSLIRVAFSLNNSPFFAEFRDVKIDDE